MFNPFAQFDPRFLAGFRQKGVKAFVQQTYDRGRNLLGEQPLPAYLLIHFHNASKAREHFDAIKTDPNRILYHVDDANDYQELQQRLNTATVERLYCALTIKDVLVKARKHYDRQIRYFIDHKTNWQPRGYERVHFWLDIIFGEIYVRLAYGTKEIKMKLDEFENQVYVL